MPPRRRLTLLLVVALSLGASPAIAAPTRPSTRAFVIAAFADNRKPSESVPGAFPAILREIRDAKVDPEAHWPAAQVVIGAGDICLAAENQANWKLWQEVFADPAGAPRFLPCIGNFDGDDVTLNRKVILPAQKIIVGEDPAKYYADWRNARVIVSGDEKFVRESIRSARGEVDHVFVVDHYPVFPRGAHEEDLPAKKAAYWSMLVENRDIVRAFICGHTHHYSRMRVANPKGPAADKKSFPDEEGGIYQIDCGNGGRSSHGDPRATLMEIMVDGPNVSYRALQAANDAPAEFRVADRW